MKKEEAHFYFIIGIMFIVMGVLALVWGSIIPTFFPRNDLPQEIFFIAGILLIIFGAIIAVFLRKGLTATESEIKDGGLDQ